MSAAARSILSKSYFGFPSEAGTAPCWSSIGSEAFAAEQPNCGSAPANRFPTLWYWLDQYECCKNRSRSNRDRESPCRAVDSLPHAGDTPDARREAEPGGAGPPRAGLSRSVRDLAACRQLAVAGKR